MEQETFCSSISYSILLTALFSLLGYFVYGSINGALGILLLCIACDFVLLISIIPFVGWLIQTFVMKMIVIPGIVALTGIYLTWLTTTIFFVYLAYGIIVTATVSIAILRALQYS
ncbi:MAG: hypothetical protein N2V72_00535 [Methanophagales archaeon]|nr:hypothetical protein [Methanophagales archaeon]